MNLFIQFLFFINEKFKIWMYWSFCCCFIGSLIEIYKNKIFNVNQIYDITELKRKNIYFQYIIWYVLKIINIQYSKRFTKIFINYIKNRKFKTILIGVTFDEMMCMLNEIEKNENNVYKKIELEHIDKIEYIQYNKKIDIIDCFFDFINYQIPFSFDDILKINNLEKINAKISITSFPDNILLSMEETIINYDMNSNDIYCTKF